MDTTARGGASIQRRFPATVIRFVVLAGLVLGVVMFVAQLRIDLENPVGRWSDYGEDYASARAWRAGDDPYAPIPELTRRHIGVHVHVFQETQQNPHPPALIVLLAPLSFLDYGTARIILVLISALAIAIAVWLFARARRLPALAVTVIVLALPITHAGLLRAAVTPLVLMLLVGAWLMLESRPRLAGILLGVAAAVKLFPIVMIVALWRARRSAALRWMLGSAAGISVACGLALGPSAAIRWATKGSARNLAVWGTDETNISLSSWVMRAFGAPTLFAILGVAICIWAARRSSYWQAAAWSVLASPIAWPHYALVAVPLMIDVDTVPRRAPLAVAATAVVASADLFPNLAVTALTTVSLVLIIYASNPRRSTPTPAEAQLQG